MIINYIFVTYKSKKNKRFEYDPLISKEKVVGAESLSDKNILTGFKGDSEEMSRGKIH